MELTEAVERSTRNTRGRGKVVSWDKVAELMGNEKTPDQYRSMYRYYVKGETRYDSKVRMTANRAFTNGKTTPKEILIAELSKERTVNELCKATSFTRLEVLGSIEELRQEGYNVVQCIFGNEPGYTIKTDASTTYYEYKHYHDVSQVIKIGILSDTHIGSRYFQRTYLKMAYEDFKREGIKDVYHVGDITDGTYSNRPGSVYETYAHGVDQQVDAVEEGYPSEEGITTHLITGNHDATHMMNGGANIGVAIERRRKDFKYLGHEYAKIWLTDKVDIDLVHPRDGTSYALSYKLQKRIDAMQGGQKPKIMVVGHYHKNFSMLYRNIWAFGLPSFQAQSPFMRGMGLVSDVGYLILEIKVNEHGDLIEVTPRYKPFYEMIDEKF